MPQPNAALVSIAYARAASVTSEDADDESITIKAANTRRRGLIVCNDADKALYIKYGATASVTSFTAKVAAGGYWEMPSPVYTGVVDGIWASGPTGAARVTELT